MKTEELRENIEHNYYKVVIGHRRQCLVKPALRAIYRHWADCIRSCLSSVYGKSIELGCGCGALSWHMPELIKTDLYKHEWVDEIVDACNMPYADNECANFVAIDVLHHLSDVPAFFNEVNRALKYGGRLILLEPYISPISFIIYNYFHHEPVDMKVFPFDPVKTVGSFGEAANSAIPTLLFIRHRAEFNKRWPHLKIINIILRDAIVYPLTGGFSYRNWLPCFLVNPLIKIEDRILKYTGFINAVRMLVVIEKVSFP
jgi:SAM-dependent methyltransferase